MSNNYIIPKVLIHSDRYKNLQTDAAVLYSVLFDKTVVSDEDVDVLICEDGRRLFVTYPVTGILSDLKFDEKLTDILIRELVTADLIKVVEQQNGNPPVIIVFPVPGEPVHNDVSSDLYDPADPIGCDNTANPFAADIAVIPVSPANPILRSNDDVNPASPISISEDSVAAAAHPAGNRIIILQTACNNEFSPSVVREFWVSMQDVIDETRWDDFDYLSGWLNSRYREMHSKVAGGDMSVRIALLQDLISKSA